MSSPLDSPTADGVSVSFDAGRLDVALVHRWLSRESYWARGISEAVFRRAVAGSLCAGAYRDGAQVGFARVVTDRATFSWLCDVFVVETERGRGVGRALIAAVVAHPDLRGVRRMMLATSDAHGLYARYGFEPVTDTYMARMIANPYDATSPEAQRAPTDGIAEAYTNEPVRFGPLHVVDLAAEAAAVTEPYRNQVMSQVNGSCLHLAVFEGAYRWHHHPASDELFVVIEGELAIDLDDGTELRLGPWQAVTIPAGTVHRTRAIGRTVNLCVEEVAAETVFVEPAGLDPAGSL